MLRRSRIRGAQGENHERWLISYADFITLLFAFFVVLFANSQVDQEKVQRVSESVKEALEPGSKRAGSASRRQSMSPVLAPVDKKAGEISEPIPFQLEPDLNQLKASYQTLTSDFRTEIAEGKVQVELTRRGLVVSMREAAFFRPGHDAVQPDSYAMIEKLARTIGQIPNSLQMEGHTDSQPISNSRFRSNWELSAARSIAMMELITSRYGVPRSRVGIAGYADVVPVAPNDSEENRARNRRVDVVILSEASASP